GAAERAARVIGARGRQREARGRRAGEAQRGELVVGEEIFRVAAAAGAAVPAPVWKRAPARAAAARAHAGVAERARQLDAEPRELHRERADLVGRIRALGEKTSPH